VNALANFCFQTKQTNLEISDRLPEEYFPVFEAWHPGGLASQWIPTDHQLWKIENYREFLVERRKLLAAEANRCMEDLLHGDVRWLEGVGKPRQEPAAVLGGITSEGEEEELEALNDWVEAQGLPRGVLAFDFADQVSGEQKAVFDLAWPNGIQEELSQPVAVLLNEHSETVGLASKAGFRCFTTTRDFKDYVEKDIMAGEGEGFPAVATGNELPPTMVV
jgi:hypothetical protein